MALLVVLFLDLASRPLALAPAQARGDDGIYLQVLADQHLKGPYDIRTDGPCLEVAKDGWAKYAGGLTLALREANRTLGEKRADRPIHFSRIGRLKGWGGTWAALELTTSDATSCLLYWRWDSKPSFQLVREIRLPQ